MKRINGGMKRENKEKLILPEATENKMLQMSVHEASFDLWKDGCWVQNR